MRDSPSVADFYANPDYCAYMLSPPERESSAFLARYEAAMQKAVRALQDQDGSLDETRALFRLRAQCDRALVHIR